MDKPNLLSRRTLLSQGVGAGLLGASGLLAACTPAKDAAASGPLLTGIGGGPWPGRIERAFAKEPLANGLDWRAVVGSPTELLAKLIPARGHDAPFDVVELDSLTYRELKEADLIEPFDPSEIPNLSQLDSKNYDNYRVPYWATNPGILYNPKRFAEAGIPAPTTYRDLLDPRLNNRVQYPELGAYNNFYFLLGLAKELGGSEANPQPAFDAFARIKPYSVAGYTTTLNQSFANGDVWAVPTATSVAVRLYEAGLTDVTVSYPSIDGHPQSLAYGYLAIVKGTRRRKQALQFINAVISPSVQFHLYHESSVSPVNRLALEKAHETLSQYPARVNFLRLDPELEAKSWIPALETVDKRAWSVAWQRALDQQPG